MSQCRISPISILSQLTIRNIWVFFCG